MANTKSNQNDASAIFINQLVPTKSDHFINNIMYTENTEGMHTADLAMYLRKLHTQYDCDFIIVDCKGLGHGVCDLLLRDIVDVDTGEVYEGLSCYNNTDWAARCNIKGAAKSLWVINAGARFNSDCAIMLRDGFKSGKIKLLNTEQDGEKSIRSLLSAKEFDALDAEQKVRLQLPYINTTLLINELINLQHSDADGLIKISERNGMRKDRYSSLSYSYYVACQLEQKLRKKTFSDKVTSNEFVFRAPARKRSWR